MTLNRILVKKNWKDPFNSLSIITLIPAILIFSFVPTLHCARNFIHTNLMISFFLRKVFEIPIKCSISIHQPVHFQSLQQGIVFWLATISRWVWHCFKSLNSISGEFPGDVRLYFCFQNWKLLQFIRKMSESGWTNSST